MALAPPVWRGRVHQSLVVVLFVTGLLMGGLTSAVVLMAAGWLARPVPIFMRAAIVLLVAIGALLRDLHVTHFWVPQNARQIPQSVFQRGLGRASLQFGYELGTGVRTYIPTTLPYVVAVGLLLLTPNPLAALAAGIGFGLGRALSLLLRLLSGRDDAWDEAFERWEDFISPSGIVIAAILLFLFLALGLNG
jgi:hypothetical protein